MLRKAPILHPPSPLSALKIAQGQVTGAERGLYKVNAATVNINYIENVPVAFKQSIHTSYAPSQQYHIPQNLHMHDACML